MASYQQMIQSILKNNKGQLDITQIQELINDCILTLDSAQRYMSEYRKKGIASTLINEMLKLCKEHQTTCIMLEVRINNIPAQKLYSKFDFFEYTTKQNYYEDGEDALLMGRNM